MTTHVNIRHSVKKTRVYAFWGRGPRDIGVVDDYVRETMSKYVVPVSSHSRGNKCSAWFQGRR